MKSEILSLLREKGDYLSGQELCEQFGVSRTAVWKAINQLKKEGHNIEAVPNKGYILMEHKDVFGQLELESRMNTKWAGKPLKFYETIASTNVQAKLFAEEDAKEGLLIVSDQQTAGRGRRGRSWNSPPGCNVYFSLLLRPDFEPDRASMITLVAALAVAEGIQNTYHNYESIGIKWPNDVIANEKKICGILTEMNAERDYIHYVVPGIGINVGKQKFPQEIANVASDLETELGQKVSRAELVSNIIQAFETYYEVFCEKKDMSGLIEIYNKLLVNRDREVRVLDPKGEYNGVARGINELGELLVETQDRGLVAVYAGEVSVRGIYGYV